MDELIRSAREEDTEAAGATLADALRDGDVVWLHGPLGAGKTTLVRGLLKALGHVGPVVSPTYTLVEPYHVHGRDVVHLDLYRLRHAAELDNLGLRDLLDGHAIIIVEWPERAAGRLPSPTVTVDIEGRDEARVVRIRRLDEPLPQGPLRHGL